MDVSARPFGTDDAGDGVACPVLDKALGDGASERAVLDRRVFGGESGAFAEEARGAGWTKLEEEWAGGRSRRSSSEGASEWAVVGRCVLGGESGAFAEEARGAG